MSTPTATAAATPMAAETPNKKGSHPGAPRISPRAEVCPVPYLAEKESVCPATGEVTEEPVYFPCKRKTCEACGPHLKKCHFAHFVREFKNRPYLRSLTLTLDPKTEIDGHERLADLDEAEQREYLSFIWGKFTDSIRRYCKKQARKLVYFAVVEAHEDGRPHLHVITSLPLEEKLIRQKWFQFGGGASCSVEDIETLSDLESAISYAMKRHFDTEAYKTAHGCSYRSLYTSQGVGYNSARAKAQRRRFARLKSRQDAGEHHEKHDREVQSFDEYERWQNRAIEEAVGRVVALPDGTRGTLVRLRSDGMALVETAEESPRCWRDSSHLLPVGVSPPRIVSYRMAERGGMPSYFSRATEKDRRRFDRLQCTCRTVRYEHKYRNGRRVMWRYDRKTGETTSSVLEGADTRIALKDIE